MLKEISNVDPSNVSLIGKINEILLILNKIIGKIPVKLIQKSTAGDRRCKKVVIIGLVYDSVISAAIKLNVHRSTLTNWLKNPKKPEYHYLEP